MKKSILLSVALGATLTSGAQKLGIVDSNYASNGILIYDQSLNQENEMYCSSTPGTGGDLYVCGYSQTNVDVLVSHIKADGTLDGDFGANGVFKSDFTIGGDEYARKIIRKADGKLLVTGYFSGTTSMDVFIMQLNSDGTLDAAFGVNGIVTFTTAEAKRAYDVDVRSDGKIVLSGDMDNAGNKDFFVMLLNEDGSVVNAFGTQGTLMIGFSTNSDSFMALELDKANDMYVAGRSHDGAKYHAAIAKVKALGFLDNTFGASGKLTFQEGGYSTLINNIKLDGNSKLVGVGYVVGGISEDLYIFRMDKTGTFDNTFDTDGRRQFGLKIGNTADERFYGLDFQADGKILATASFNDGGAKSVMYMRLKTDGKSDAGFGGPYGYVLIPDAEIKSAWFGDIHVVSDHRALVAGRMINSTYNTIVAAVHLTEPFPTSATATKLNALRVFPNPVQAQFALDLEWANGTMELRDMSGRVVAQWTESSSTYAVPANLTKGVYFLKLQANSGFYCTKIRIN